MKDNKLKDHMMNFDEVWDFELNKGVDIEKISTFSNKQYYWKCLKGHPSYLCSPYKKVSRNYGCPVCSNYKIITGINDLYSNYPNLMLDWDYDNNTEIDPKKIPPGTAKIVAWKCHICGNRWNGSVRKAVKKEVNCPLCSRKNSGNKCRQFHINKTGGIIDKALIQDWDFELNDTLPSDHNPHSDDKIKWKCHKCGYKWIDTINNRSNSRGCPKCSGKVLVPGENDLETLFPEIAKEWHPTKNGLSKPSDYFPKSNKKKWWLCPNGHEYEATISHRTGKDGTGCPKCNAGRQTSFREQAFYYYIKKLYPSAINRYKASFLGKYELDIFIPEIRVAIEYDGEAWHNVNNYDRERRKYSICKKNRIKLYRIKENDKNIENDQDIADYIYYFKYSVVEEDLSQMISVILERICFKYPYFLNPIDVNVSRDKYEILDYARKIEHSFAEIYPEIAKEWHPTKNGDLTPYMFKPHSGFKGWWICPKCGYEYMSTFNHRASGTGCYYCGLKKMVENRRKNKDIKEKTESR